MIQIHDKFAETYGMSYSKPLSELLSASSKFVVVKASFDSLTTQKDHDEVKVGLLEGK